MMEEESLAGLFFGVYIFLNFLHTCMLTLFIMKLQKNKAFVNAEIIQKEANPYCVGDLFDTNPSAETLTRPIEAYEDPLNHSEPKYAEVDSTMTEKYDHLNYLQQNTKKHLSYDKLKILDEEKVQN